MDVKHTFVIISAVTFGVLEDLESTRKKRMQSIYDKRLNL